MCRQRAVEVDVLVTDDRLLRLHEEPVSPAAVLAPICPRTGAGEAARGRR
jgi:hypothetical protein